MTATLAYVGRALVLHPASLGELFHNACTVTRVSFEMSYIEDEDTGAVSRVRRRVSDNIKMYWYDVDPTFGEKVFAAYSGYGTRIINTLKKRGINVRVENRVDDGLTRPDLTALRDIIWRGRQKEIVAKIMAYRGGTIVCPTAYGKTFMIKALAKAYPEASLIATVDSTDIAEPMYDELLFALGPKTVGMVGAGKNNPRRVTVAMSQSLHKCSKDANLVLADECHKLLTENYIKKLNKFYRARLFGLTASLNKRSDNADGFAEAIFGPVLVNVGYQEGVGTGNIVQLDVEMVRVKSGPNTVGINDKVALDRLALWQNEARNNIIANVVREAEQRFGDDAQILIMVDKTEHAYRLGQLLPDYAIVTGEPDAKKVKRFRNNGTMTADQEVCTKAMRQQYRKDFEANKLKRAIATKIWSKGVDFCDLQVLVRADGAASQIDSDQVPGRLSRRATTIDKEKGLLIDFIDAFSSQLQGRSAQRLRAYKKNGWNVRSV